MPFSPHRWGGTVFAPPLFRTLGGNTPPIFRDPGGGIFVCPTPKKWGGTKSAKPKVMGGNKFHDLPPISPHFPLIFMIIPPFIWGGGNPKWMGGQLPPQMLPPHFSRPWGGKFFVPPHRDFRGGEIFSWGGTPNGGKKASMFKPMKMIII